MDTMSQDSSLFYPAVGTKLPTGNADFTKLRTVAGIYVDKTDMVLDLASNYSKVFLSRPRRFGKTLLTSTFETLFRDGLKYFGGSCRLYKGDTVVEEPFKIAGKWDEAAYPVVRLDFSFMKTDGKLIKSSLEEVFRNEVLMAFEDTGFHLDTSSDFSWITQLKTWLIKKCSPASIVLLIDEYDAGLGSRLSNKSDFSYVLSLLSDFFTMVKATDKVWRFVFITGIARFGKASIFSSMNDLTDITFMPEFGTLLGYTEQEIRENFSSYLEKAAKINNTDVDGLLDDMRRHYDGFCFDSTALTHVYAPWSVLKFLITPKSGFANYWADSSGNASALVEYIKSGKTNLRALLSDVTVSLTKLQSIMTMEDLQQELLLNQAGYLTIVGVTGNMVELGTPNLEVAATLAELCLSKLLPENTGRNSDLPDIYKTLQTGSPDVLGRTLNAYLSFIPYQQYPIDCESAVRGIALAFCLGRGIDCVGERVNSWGRSDLEVRMANVYWVMEFKFVKKEEPNQEIAVEKALAEGLEQIQQRKYGAHVVRQPVVRVSIVFSEAERQIVRWQLLTGEQGAIEPQVVEPMIDDGTGAESCVTVQAITHSDKSVENE